MATNGAVDAVSKEYVQSKDGIKIGYRKLGSGPGLVIVHGSLSSGYNHMQLAVALADDFTVYLMDRRGRGLSGPYKDPYHAQQEVDDILALIKKTHATYVFAVSMGAALALQASTRAHIAKLAVYEPLLFSSSKEPKHLVRQIDEALKHQDVPLALATAMKGAQLGSPVLNAMPLWLISTMTKGMINWTPPGEYVAFKDLATPLHYEGLAIAELSDDQRKFSGIKAKVLLMGGGKSSQFLKDALDRVHKIIPSSIYIELPGADHSSAWNAELRGNPKPIARELVKFFGRS